MINIHFIFQNSTFDEYLRLGGRYASLLIELSGTEDCVGSVAGAVDNAEAGALAGRSVGHVR